MQPINRAASILRKKAVACLLLALVAAATWWPRIEGPIDLRWDAGAYYILGTSLARGEGYRMLSEPGSIPSSLHPPLLPVLVAALQLGLGTSDHVVVGHALRLGIALASMGYAVSIFLLLGAYLPRIYAFVAACLALLPPQYVYFSDALYAETVFGLFTVLFFILNRHRHSTACFLVSGLCAILAYEVRTAGIALLAAWIADCLLRKEFKRAGIALVISAVPVLAWMGWIKAAESSPEYQRPSYAYQTAPYLYFNVSYAKNLFELADPFSPELGPLTTSILVARVRSNAKALPMSIGQAVSSWATSPRIALPLAFLVFAGMVLQIVRKQHLMILYVALSLAAVCLTPFEKQYVRYLIPLYPFFALALFQVLALFVREPRISTTLLPTFGRSVLVMIIVVVISWQGFAGVRSLYALHHDDVAYEQGGRLVQYKLFHYAPVGTAFDEGLEWLKRNSQSTDTIAATDPQWVYLRTGRKAVLPPFELNGEKAQRLIDTVPVKYLIAETKPQRLGLGAYYRFTSALLRDNPFHWDLVWSSSDRSMEIYRRTRPMDGSARPD
jgi:hypothetical protein